jgi:hypothetical protein
VLDNAILSYCKQKDIVVHLTCLVDEGVTTVKKPLSQFISTQTGKGLNNHTILYY